MSNRPPTYNDDHDENARTTFMASTMEEQVSQELLDFYFEGDDQPSFKFTDIIMDSAHSIWDAQQCWAMFSLSKLNQLLTPRHNILPEGSTPIVQTVTFRFPPAPAHTAPCVFKLLLTNTSEIPGFWQIFTQPPQGWKKHVQRRSIYFSGAAEFKDGTFRDSPIVVSHLWASKFSYDSYDSKKTPTTLNTLRDLNAFEITPLTGSLKSKESCVLTVKYPYSNLGMQQISVMLRVFPSIFVWIDITGRTLEAGQPFLQFMHTDEMLLHSVSLTDINPPVQMCWLYNGGSNAASFTVDLEPFKYMKNDNFGHAVIECLTPKGEVEPKSWTPIKLRFSPLEYTNYEVPLIVHTNYDKTPMQLMLYGATSINPYVCLRPSATAENSRKFVLYKQGVPVTISPSHIVVGHLIPTGHSATRMVFLTNLHPRNNMKFHWTGIDFDGGGSISITPECGRLAPKEEAAFKVIIKAGDTPMVMDSVVTVTFEDETSLVFYEFVLGQWKDYIRQLERSPKASRVKDINEGNHRKPERPEQFSKFLAISYYIADVSQYDNLTFREMSRVGISMSSRCKCERNITTIRHPFTYIGSRFIKTILETMIWDLLQTSNFECIMKQATKREAPTFYDYLNTENRHYSVFNTIDENFSPQSQSQISRESSSQTESDQSTCADFQPLAVSSTANILERSVFNILHEMAERYAHNETRERWFEIPPVEAKALVDVDELFNSEMKTESNS